MTNDTWSTKVQGILSLDLSRELRDHRLRLIEEKQSIWDYSITITQIVSGIVAGG